MTARGQMALIGVTGVVLELVTVHAAFSGLHRVDVAYADVGRLARAQRYFQDADQAHDALHADVLQALLEGNHGPTLPVDAVGGLHVDAAAFRKQLQRVDTVTLTPALTRDMRDLRPVQMRYVVAAEELSRLAHRDPAAARTRLPAFTAVFVQLEQEQATVTARLGDEAQEVQTQADREERSARWQITVASLIALLGLVALTVLLGRLGRSLSGLLARERGVAETLQRSLLPEALPEIPGVDLAARYVPGGAGAAVGGDWYDVIALSTGCVGLVMGDVAGHDLRAASVMGQLRNALRAYVAEDLAPGDVLERVNALAMTQSPNEMATCLYAVLDPGSATFELANAGHYPPFLIDAEGTVILLEQPPCPPVGAVRDARYSSVVHSLPPGSTLVLFTDGLVERRAIPVDEGLDQLRQILAQPHTTPEALCDAAIAELLGGEPPADDVAMLVVRCAATLGQHLALRWPAEPSCLVDLRRTLERWLTEAGADEVERYEIVVACSEAATNAIEHAYGPGAASFEVDLDLDPATRLVSVTVRDHGHWRDSRGHDRGRGLRLVEGLMDDVRVLRSSTGTQVHMRRTVMGRPVAGDAGTPEQEQVPV